MDHISFIILALCNGAIALTISKSTIFENFREWVAERSDFFGELVQCPYCTSHWLCFAAMLVYHPRLVHSFFAPFDYVVTTFALIALSAMSAGGIFKLFSSSHNG